MRIGHGFDAHQFAKGRKLIIGGVDISYDKGLLAHSDGDVLIHALVDALLGAAGLGDIGKHFPDTDMAYKDMDSRILLRKTTKLLSESQYKLVNADITVIAQAPKMNPHIANMLQNLCADLHTEPHQLNIKATTTEGMGYTGRGEGIAVHAVVLLQQTMPK